MHNPKHMELPLFSVIVPSYRQFKTIRASLESILRQSFRDFELIVVDSSHDATTSEIKSVLASFAGKLSFEVKLIESAVRATAGMQRTLGIQNARAGWVFTTDTDCILGPGYFEKLADLVSINERSWGKNFALSGALRNGTPQSRIGSACFHVEFSSFAVGMPQSQNRFVPSANLLFPRDFALENGGFADFPVSDDLYTLNLWMKKGLRTLFEPELEVVHMNRTDFRDSLSHQFKLGMDSSTIRTKLKLADRWLVWALPLWLVLPFWRLLRVSARVCLRSRESGVKLPYLLALPETLLVLLVWSAGFSRASLRTIVSQLRGCGPR